MSTIKETRSEISFPFEGRAGHFLSKNFRRLTAVPREIIDARLAQAEVNPETRIKIVKNVAPPHDVNGRSYGIHAAEVQEGSAVLIHIHDEKNPPEQGGDLETYDVREVGENGNGVMSTGIERDGQLYMNPDEVVAPGTKIVISPGTAHELHGPAKIVFSCPEDHLSAVNRRFANHLPRIQLVTTTPGTIYIQHGPESNPNTIREFMGQREGVIFITSLDSPLPVVLGGRRQIIGPPLLPQTEKDNLVKQDK